MTTAFTDLDDPGWLALFENVQESWFRLETLQAYSVEYERDEYEAFKRTGRLEREPGSWQDLIRRHTASGRQLRRVHVVIEPLTDYLRYEMAAYLQNSQAGEDIRLIPTPQGAWPAGLPRNRDFWLFDDRDIWEMSYDDQGRFLSATLAQSREHLDECRRLRDLALDQSISLADYLRHAA